MRSLLATTFLCLLTLSSGCGDPHIPDAARPTPSQGAGPSQASSAETQPAVLLSPDSGTTQRRSEALASPSAAKQKGKSTRKTLRVVIHVPETLALSEAKPEVVLTRADALKEIPYAHTNWNAALAHGTRVTPVPPPVQVGGRQVIELTCPRPPGRARVFVRMGDRVASDRVPLHTGKPAVVDFQETAATLTSVEVQTADGRPTAGVRVTQQSSARRNRIAFTPSEIDLSAVSDEEGRVQIWLQAKATPAAIMAGLPNERSPYRVDLDGTVTPNLADEVQRASGKTVVTLPPAGSIDVQLDLNGLPLEPGARLEVRASNSSTLSFPVLAESLRIWPVALNQTYTLQLVGASIAGFVEVTGPAALDETVEAKIAVHRTPVITARLVDKEGAPLARFPVALRSSDPAIRRAKAQTDALGRLRLEFPKVPPGTNLGFLTFQEVQSQYDKDPQKTGRWEGDAQVAAGVLDVGDVPMSSRSILVAGRVTNDRGKPVFNARVDLLLPPPNQRAQEPAKRSRKSRVFASEKSQRDGSFLFYLPSRRNGPPPAGLQVTATRRSERTVHPVRFAPGQSDLRVMLERPGSLTIDPTQAKAQCPSLTRLGLRRADTGKTEQTVATDAAVTLEELPAGEYEVIAMFAVGRTKVTIPVAMGVLVRGGSLTADPRLNPLRLDAYAKSQGLRVLGPDGTPPESITLGMRIADGSDLKVRLKPGDGTFLIPGPVLAASSEGGPEGAYWIEAYDCRRVYLPELPTNGAVRLEPAIEVSLQLSGAPLPGEAFELMVHSASPSTRGTVFTSKVRFDTTGRGVVRVSHQGSYMLGELHRSLSMMGPSAPLSASTSRIQTFEVGTPLNLPWQGQRFDVPARGGLIQISARPKQTEPARSSKSAR